MGREIRRVPADWQHPVNDPCEHIGRDTHRGRPCYRPLYDNDYESAALEWERDNTAWLAGTWRNPYTDTTVEHEKQFGIQHYWEYKRPPDRENYRERKWTAEEATCYQIYETVSEGTPVSPIFETLDSLTQWLVDEGYSQLAAESFAKEGWAPSAVFYTDKTSKFIGALDIESLAVGEVA